MSTRLFSFYQHILEGENEALCVVLYESRVRNANVTLPQNHFPCGTMGGRIAFGDRGVGTTSECDPNACVLFSLKPQLQIRAGAEKSTETREIINRYRKLGITRSIMRCAVAVAMPIMYGSEH